MPKNNFGEFATLRIRNSVYKKFKAYVVLNESTVTEVVGSLMEKWVKEQGKKRDKLLGE